jgi:hypothetical protein
MGAVISLSKARTARAKAAKGQTASENRAKHGQTKAERDLEKAREALAKKRLEETRRDE